MISHFFLNKQQVKYVQYLSTHLVKHKDAVTVPYLVMVASCYHIWPWFLPYLVMVGTGLTCLKPSPEYGAHLVKHGDAVKDVAFAVEDCRGLYKRAVEAGAISVREPWTETDDNGTITFASVRTVRPPPLLLPIPIGPLTHPIELMVGY